MKKWPRIGILVGFLTLLAGTPLTGFGQTQRQTFTQVWRHTDSIPQVEGDSIVLSWVDPAYERKSYGTLAVIQLGFDQQYLAAVQPMDLFVRLQVKAVLNTDLDDYDPVNDEDTVIVLDLHLGRRSEGAAKAFLTDALLDRALDHSLSAIQTIKDARKLTFIIDEVWADEGAGYTLEPALPEGLVLDVQLHWDLVPIMDPSIAPIVSEPDALFCTGISEDPVELQVNWSPVEEAYEYHLEWTWSDTYTIGGTTDGEGWFDLDRNATRVTIPKITDAAPASYSYRIPLLFDRGFLVYRVRAMGRDPDNPQLPVYGDWSLDISSGVKSDVDADDHFYEVTAAHRQNLNWQVTSTYAEEGKRKEVMTYADGSQRSRQMVTRNNSLLVPIIGETLYDLVGRPAVEAMPVPLVNAQGCPDDHGAWGPIDYYPLFNQARVEELDEEEELVVVAREYTYEHMTFDEESCAGRGMSMHPVNGAELYYNPAHMGITDALTGKPSFLPRADGYPFSQTEYTRDNTGRVRRSSGVGDAFKLGSEHATAYFYGKPEQNKLDRLFGSEAGYANHYQKNVVFDPNGQGSVSYVDRVGRTVATALTGEVPSTVGPLATAQDPVTAPSFRTDLFGGLSNLECETNKLEQIDDSPALVLRDQIVVPANGLTYRFKYDVFPGLVEDPCLTVCLSCVYELSVSLFDNCGNDLFVGWSTVIGSFKEDGDFILDCEASDPDGWTDLVELNVGEYQLIKILRVSSEARSAYVEEILANGDDHLHDSCFVPLDILIAQHRAAVDTSACYVTCASCLADLGELEDFLAQGKGTAQEYELLREQCDQLCENFSWCDVAYRTMLEDMREMGQYGGVDHMLPAVNGTDRSSVYYFSNGTNSILHQRGYNWDHTYSNSDFPVDRYKPLWRQPKFMLEDDSYVAEYRDETGMRTRVTVTLVDGTWTPGVENAGAVYPVEGSDYEHFTYPENLSRLADFLDYFQPGFERSLVFYHPEYCYWLDCRNYTKRSLIVDPLSSDAFDDRLLNATFAEAIATGWVDLSSSAPLVRFHVDDISSPDLDIYDPFSTHLDLYGDHAQQLRDKVADHTGGQSMAQFAASMVRDLPGGISGEFGDGWDDPSPIAPEVQTALDKEWLLFKTLYLSEKYRAQKQRRDAQMLVCGCSGVNYCIGEGDNTAWRNRMWPVAFEPPIPGSVLSSSMWTSPEVIQRRYNSRYGRPINMLCQPCGNSSAYYYLNKVPRFPDPGQFPGMGQSVNDLAYQNYVLTGNCPVVSWLRMLLEELAQQELLDRSAVEIEGLMAGTELYMIMDMQGGSYVGDGMWSGVITGSVLAGELDLGSGGGSCPLMLTAASTYPDLWTSIVAIPSITTRSDGSVDITLVYQNSTGELVNTTATGFLCGGLTTCEFDPICTTNEFGLQAQALLSAIAEMGSLVDPTTDLFSTRLWEVALPDILESGPYLQELLPPYFLDQFGPGSELVWEWDAIGEVFALFADGVGSPRFEFAVTGYDGMSVSDLSDAFEFRNLRALAPSGFEVEVYEEDADLFDGIPPVLIGKFFGTATLISSSGTVELAVGKCGGPDMDQACKGLEFDVVKAYERVVRDYFQAEDTWFTDGPGSAGNWDLLQHPAITGELELLLYDLNCPYAEILAGDLCIAGDDEGPVPISGLPGYTCVSFGSGFPTVCYPDHMDAALALAHGRLGAPAPYGQPAVDGSLHAFSLQLLDAGHAPLGGDFLAIVFTGPLAVQFCTRCKDALLVEEEPMTPLAGFWSGPNSASANDPYAGFRELFGMIPPVGGSLDELDAEILDSEGVESGNLTIPNVPSLQELLALPEFSAEDAANVLFNGIPAPWGGSSGPEADFALFGAEQGCEFWASAVFNAVIEFNGSDYAEEMELWMSPYVPGLVEIMLGLEVRGDGVDCDCLSEGAYVDHLQPYIDWMSPAPLPSTEPLLFEEFSACPVSSCTMLYQIGDFELEVPKYLLYYLMLMEISSHEDFGTFAPYIAPYFELASQEDFEDEEFCACFEGYLLHLQTVFIDDEPNTPVILDPRTWSMSLFCSGEEPCMVSFPMRDTPWEVPGYLVYQLVQQQVDNWLEELDPPVMPHWIIPSYGTFQEADICDCVVSYFMRLAVVMSDNKLSEAELYDERLWDIVKFCTPDPCAEVLPPHTPVIIAPEKNPCVAALYANADANAHAQYAAQMERIRRDLTAAYNANCLSVLESFTMDYQDPEHHYTLYYYDQSGSLVRTVPPEGVEPMHMGAVDPITGDLFNSADQLLTDAIAADRANGTRTVFMAHRMPSDHVYNSLGNPIRSAMPDQDKMDIWETALPTGLPAWLTVSGSDIKSGGQGWLTGGRTVGVSERGYSYRTGDGGASWQRINGLVAADLNAVHFPVAMVGYAVGKHGTLLKTVDMGTTWDMLPPAVFAFDELLDVHFSDATTGVVTGTEGRYWYTTNGGVDFEAFTLPNTGRVEGVGFADGLFHLAGVTSDGLNGFIATLEPHSFPTAWTLQVIERIRHFTDLQSIDAVNEDLAFAGGAFGVLLRTDNAGEDWTTVASGSKDAFRNLAFHDSDHGMAIMDSAGVGVLRHTQDGGRSWLPVLGTAGLDLASLVVYKRESSMSKAVAVGKAGAVVRIVLGPSGIGVDNRSLPSLGDLTTVFAVAGDLGGPEILLCMVTNTTGAVRMTWDLLSGAAWGNAPLPGGTPLLQVAFASLWATLGTDGVVRLIDIGLDPPDPAPSLSLVFTSGPDYSAIHATANGDLLLYNSTTGVMDFIDLSAGPPYSITTNPNTGDPHGSPVSAMANMGTRVVTVGVEGDIRWADQPVTSWAWSSSLAKPLPMRTIAGTFPLAAGDEGALMIAFGSGPAGSLHSSVDQTIHGITAPGSTGDIYLAGQGGKGYMMNLSSVAVMDLGLPLTLPLNDVVAFDDKVYMAANNGSILYRNGTNPWTVLPYNSGHINGLANQGNGQVVAVGQRALVHRLNGSTRMPVNDVFPPMLAAVSMTSSGNGYVVGLGGFARHTSNGGQSWSVVSTTAPLVGDLHAVRVVTPGEALAVGSNGLAVSLVGNSMVPLSEDFGTSDLNDVALATNGSAVIVGTNGSTGVYFLREAGENFGMAVSVPEVGSINAAWAFPRIVSTSGPVNSFLIAGNYMPTPEAAFARLLRFNDDGTFSAFQNVHVGNAEGDVTALYFHDHVVGYAGTSSGQLFRTGSTSVDHSTFAWGAALATDDQLLPTQPYTGPMSIRTIGFSSRHRGFMGGSYNSTANYARVITDESGLYSQRFWYDKLGRIVLSQNSKQFNASAHKQYSYSLYDELGRVHEAGQVTDFNDELAAVFGAAVQNVVQPFTIDPQNLLAWLDGQPTGSRTEVVRTIYDEDLLGSGSFFSTHEQENLRLRVAATLYLDNGEDIAHASAYSYDIHGNVKELVQYHARLAGDCAGCTDGGIKHLQYIYDLISGNVKQVSYQAGKPDQFHHRYRYDADNRIDRVETSRNALTWREDARYFYYPHGPLQRVELGNDKVQGVDYAYTLQGWLKGINSTLLTPENDMGQDAAYELSGNPNALIGRDVYGLSLGYYGDNDYAAIDDSRWSTVADRPFAPIGTTGTVATNHQELYNGNIAHTTNTLAPFGGYPNSAVAPGQVLAMVYQYDQLNRLKQAKGVTGITTGNTWDAITDATANRYKSEYAYDANGNIMAAERYDQDGNQYDGLEYRYHVDGNGNKVRNRLYQLLDLADEEDDFANDISDLPFQDTEIVDPQGIGSGGWINEDNNYRYDELGNLIRDAREEIDLIEWTVSGKVRAVHRTPSSSRMPLSFGYGAGGQRITKVVGDPDASTPTGYREHYIRDAQGNVMATYRHQLLPVTGPEPGFEASLKLTERPIYGSSRLGVDAHALELGGLGPEDPNPYLLDNPIGKVHYELTDHLGNVSTVITDELIGVDIEDNASAFEYFQPYLVSAQGYEPFGSLLPGRNYSSVVGTDPDAMVVEETFEGAEVVANVVNGWSANAVAVLSMDDNDTRRLMVSNAIQWDGAQLSFATIAGESYTLTFDLDMGTTATIGLAIYAENPSGAIPPGPTWTVGGTKTVTFTATTALTRIKIYKVSNTPTTHYFIDNVAIQGPQLLLGNYRFGFNGMEKDDEVHGATGASYDFGARLYDPRVGRFLSKDPQIGKYPQYTPYSFAANNPIMLIDKDGEVPAIPIGYVIYEGVKITIAVVASAGLAYAMSSAIVRIHDIPIWEVRKYPPGYTHQRREQNAAEAYLRARDLAHQESVRRGLGQPGGDGQDPDRYKRIGDNVGLGGAIVMAGLELLDMHKNILIGLREKKEKELMQKEQEIRSVEEKMKNQEVGLSTSEKTKYELYSKQLPQIREDIQGLKDAEGHVDNLMGREKRLQEYNDPTRQRQDNTRVGGNGVGDGGGF